MHWIALVLAGVLEIAWATAMKQSDGFTRIIPSIVTICTAGASFWLLAFAMKALPLGTSYAVWTGIGAAGAFVAGVVLFGEQLSVLRVVSIAFIVLGMIGLRLAAE